MKFLRIAEVKVPLDATFDETIKILIQKTGLTKYKKIKIAKKAIDARDKANVHFVYSFDVYFDGVLPKLKWHTVTVQEDVVYKTEKVAIKNRKQPVVVGSGPAGLFAALTLAEAGLNPIIIEQGKKVEERKVDVQNFWKDGKLLSSSNALFGEGGAGTFSDGKLTTGIKDIYNSKILNEFVQAGATEDILYAAKPHIGTDVLFTVVKNLREKIISLGGKFLFETKLNNILAENNKLVGIEANNSQIDTDYMVLAVGHSARDTFEMLHKKNVAITQKPFSVGVRIEHTAKMINFSQYGACSTNPNLGAADYKLVSHLEGGRSAYTFCMCPGGYVTACSSEVGTVVTNGMSEYKRDGANSNAALLVGVTTQDFLSDHPLAGIEFQRKLEKAAFVAGGGNYGAPSQLVGDFLKDISSKSLGNVEPTYKPFVNLTSVNECLPDFVVNSLKQAIINMDKRLKGFATYDAVLTGVETRSSSPIRINRNDNLQSSINGILPCGEGAGYAGGIMSAAADGIKCALKIIELEMLK